MRLAPAFETIMKKPPPGERRRFSLLVRSAIGPDREQRYPLRPLAWHNMV